MEKYKINELFYSVQCEGANTGTPAVFVRFAGCNLKCDFCDTFFDPYEEMTLDAIWTEIAKYNTPLVICTGGEPMMQLDKEFIDKRDELGLKCKIAVETNGTVFKPDVLSALDWITCSPKYQRVKLKFAHEVKFLMDSDGKFFLPKDQTREELESIGENLYLQPISLSKKATDLVVDFVKSNPKYKISVQIHKIIGVR